MGQNRTKSDVKLIERIRNARQKPVVDALQGPRQTLESDATRQARENQASNWSGIFIAVLLIGTMIAVVALAW